MKSLEKPCNAESPAIKCTRWKPNVPIACNVQIQLWWMKIFFLSEPVAFRRVYGLESYSPTSGESNHHRQSVSDTRVPRYQLSHEDAEHRWRWASQNIKSIIPHPVQCPDSTLTVVLVTQLVSRRSCVANRLVSRHSCVADRPVVVARLKTADLRKATGSDKKSRDSTLKITMDIMMYKISRRSKPQPWKFVVAQSQTDWITTRLIWQCYSAWNRVFFPLVWPITLWGSVLTWEEAG